VIIDAAILSNEEKISFALRALYHSRGYVPYRMGRFEEYELYMKNKDFLPSPEVITFTDTNGKLKAIKPDVTLSIVRSACPAPGQTVKLYYDENVCRVSDTARGFREIRQAGLECIGAVDEKCIGEVLELALESLGLIAEDSRLCVSHLGIVSALLDRALMQEEARARALKLIGEKNLHELAELCRSCGVEEKAAEKLCALVLCSGTPDRVLPRLREIGCPEEYTGELEHLTAMLQEKGRERLVIDFSILGDMRYYNGVAFRGYVSGVPSGVLSGGQYDRLLERLGKQGGAVGFACYLDKLERIAGSGVTADA